MRRFLHVGCGRNRKHKTTPGLNSEAWEEVRFDIDPAAEPDLVGSMTDLSQVGDDSFDAIFSSHNIEHLYAHEVPIALGEFCRVLKPTGFCIVTCPDVQAIAALVAADKLLEPAYMSPAGPITPFDMLYGHRQSIAQGNHFMAHRSGFTRKVLVNALAGAAFGSVACMQRGGPHYDLWALATKSQVDEAAIRDLAGGHFPLSA
jgi:SAM-dependent methyltransferase